MPSPTRPLRTRDVMTGEGVPTAKLLELSSDLPVVIEIVDAEEAIERFMVEVDRMVGEGLVTLEKVRIIELGP